MPKLILIACLLLLACHPDSAKKQTDVLLSLETKDRITVVYFLNTECPICQKYSGNFSPILNRYGKNIRFYYVFPGKQNETGIQTFCRYDSLPDSTIVIDKDNQITKKLGAEITPQVFIYKNKTLFYSGKIDDRFETISSYRPKASVNYIENALISLLKNEVVEIKKTKPVGCFIEPY